MRRALGLIILTACGGHAATPAPRADRPRLTPALVAALATDPDGVIRGIAPARGLVHVQLLGCEQEEQVEAMHHLCGAEVATAAATLQERLARAASGAAEDELPDGGITCDADLRCTLPPGGECNPLYELRFVDDPQRGPVLIGVVERDDWQHPDSPEVDAELRRLATKIDATFTAAADAGCR